jgi:hypothetical protein
LKSLGSAEAIRFDFQNNIDCDFFFLLVSRFVPLLFSYYDAEAGGSTGSPMPRHGLGPKKKVEATSKSRCSSSSAKKKKEQKRQIRKAQPQTMRCKQKDRI